MSYFFQDFEKEYQVIPLDRTDLQNRQVSINVGASKRSHIEHLYKYNILYNNLQWLFCIDFLVFGFCMKKLHYFVLL